MFTLTQIKEAHSKVKSGKDFPGYIQEIKQLGVVAYDQYVSDGRTRYMGKDSFGIISDAKYASLEIAKTGDVEKLKHALKIHQNGETDYLTFCKQSAESGVEKWMVDTQAMLCTYYDESGNEMVVEVIPS
ncbi:DUF1398 domain-containing protein [Dyadobacter frigoris]|uniref:DUF1398 domain-containing protein n=1 Tax=Dyadobacter frigoris TaxID=2576211 RepID=A0A4U6CYK1_9BACT|nr:DUF1398 family protein [Dyadobacter frigoris]TKT88867.1 DUF1398 domain-containing protein [Dyadobacter frigoris]GLU56059.1 hypothetical protein Dfri01_55200 [Dyadobacter frigoris]